MVESNWINKIIAVIQPVVEKINEYCHLKALKLAIVQLLPILIVVSLLTWINYYLNIRYLKLGLMVFLQIYPFILISSYGYYYAIEKKQSPIMIMTMDITLMALISTFSFNKEMNIWQLTLPVILLGFILNGGITLIFRTPSFKFSLPQAVNDYLLLILQIILSVCLFSAIASLSFFLLPTLILIFQYIMIGLDSLYGILIVILITVFFWAVGMHGVAFIGTLFRPIWIQMFLYNLILFSNNQQPTFIGIEPFYQWFVWIGGSGATLGLVILMRYVAKSQHLKNLGRDALKSGLVNINEQIIFGTPIVMNKKMIIPFVLTPCLLAIISYYVMVTHLLPSPSLLVPWVFPFIIGSLISVGGIIKVMIFSILLLILSVFLYLPFFISYDKQLKQVEGDS